MPARTKEESMTNASTLSSAEAQARATAREYFRTRGTEASLATIRGRVAAAFEALETVVAGVDPATAARRPAEGEWSVHEVVDHLVETERASLDELWCLLAGQRPSGGPIPASLQSRAPLTRPWPWLLRELASVHRDVLAALDAIPEDFATEARAALVMVVNIQEDGRSRPLEWVEDVDWKTYAIIFRLHAIDHMNQAKKGLAALGGGPPPRARGATTA
jgi:hypothetical protein